MKKVLLDVSREEAEIMEEFPGLPPEYHILAYRLALAKNTNRYWARVVQILCFFLGMLLTPIVMAVISLALKK